MKLEHLDAARRRGKAPEGPVLLSLVPLCADKIPEDVALIELRDMPDDLRCLIDLHVIVGGLESQKERAIELIDRALRFGARDVESWIIDRDRWVSCQYNHRRYLREVPPLW